MKRDLSLGDRQDMVQALWDSVNEGGAALDMVPTAIKNILLTEAWKERQDGRRVHRLDNFREFIEAPPRAGCGWSIDKVEKLIRDDPEALAMFRKAVTREHGGDRHSEAFKSDNVTLERPERGNTRAYTLDRLYREAPELYKAVCDGAMSANAAAIEAGFRKKPEPFEQIKKLIPKLSDDERRQLKDML